MSHWNPKALWDELVQALKGWMGEEEEEQASDPSLLLHLMYTAPLVLAVLALMRRVA